MKPSRVIIISLVCLLATFILFALESYNHFMGPWFSGHVSEKFTYPELLGFVGLLSVLALAGGIIAALVSFISRRLKK